MDILIITNGGIGDQIHYSSVIQGIKDNDPESAITIFCNPELSFIYEHDENISCITSCLDDLTFDVGYNFGFGKKVLNAIFMEVEIKERIGYTAINDRVVPTNQAAKNLLRFIVSDKIKNDNLKKTIKDRKSLSEWFCEIANVKWIRPYFTYESKPSSFFDTDVVIQYGTSKDEKNWPDEYYEILIKDLIKSGKSVFVTCHESHREYMKKLYHKLRDEIGIIDIMGMFHYLAGNMKELSRVANLINRTKMVVTPDTAMAHIALAMNKRTIVMSNNYGSGIAYSDTYKNLEMVKEESMLSIKPETILERIKG